MTLVRPQVPPDFATEIDRLWARAKLARGTATRCHYMPQFLQRRWAENGILTVRDASGRISTHPIRSRKGKNLFLPFGYKVDLYTTNDRGSEDRSTLEALFGLIESRTARILIGLKDKDWVMAPEDRDTLSLFVAAAFLRLPNSIKAVQVEHQPDLDILAPGMVQHDGNTVHALLQRPFKEIAKTFNAHCRWSIVRYPPPKRQQTGDVFLRATTPDRQAPREEYPKLEDWEFHMPLDPHALMVINGWTGPNVPLPLGTCDGSAPLPWNAPGTNHWFL